MEDQDQAYEVLEVASHESHRQIDQITRVMKWEDAPAKSPHSSLHDAQQTPVRV
jgi:hypothetical protein